MVHGFKEDQGVDFDEIFSAVIKLTTLCTMLGLVTKNDLDLKPTFLHEI